MKIYEKLCSPEALKVAWKKVRKKNAGGGIDGLNPEDLDKKIKRTILKLAKRLNNQSYTPAPYQQVKTPKFNEANEWRSLSMPVVVDKIVQQAAVTLMEPVFEKEFLSCSYAYRRRKGAVRAIKRTEHILKHRKARWVVTSDIDNFFDTLNHERVKRQVQLKIDEPRLIHLIDLWLNAGYIGKKGRFSDPSEGIAQGAIISPLLSNIYLHALDRHAVDKGYDYLRYSDNFIIFAHEKNQIYLCHEDLTAYLEENLALKLNKNPYPFKHVKGGFAFLGIYFKGDERQLSREKESKNFKKLNWLTNASDVTKPGQIVERINAHIESQKRYYGFINPQRQFAAFDVHLIQRLEKLLITLGIKGILKNKDEFIDFVRQVSFYKDLMVSEKNKRSDQIATKVITALEKKSKTTPGSKKIDKIAAAKRSHAKKNRFLKKISEETEVIVSSPGIFIGKTGRRLVLREARRHIHECPFSKIRQITVTSKGISLSSDVIWGCGKNDIPLIFLNRIGKPYAVLQNPRHAAGDLSVLQVKMVETEKALILAQTVLTGKCRNQMNILKFYRRHRAKSDPVFSEQVAIALDRMNTDLKKIQSQKFTDTFTSVKNILFTSEARVSVEYWRMIKTLLPPELGFGRRVKRGAKDVVNAMLNYGYGILYQRVWNAVLYAGMNPNISFLHSFKRGKPTLIFDLIEEFRQAFVDRPLFSSMTRGSRYKRFRVDTTTGLMDKYTKGVVLDVVLKRLSTLVGYRGSKLKAEDVIVVQVKNLAAHILGKHKIYRPFIAPY